MFSAIIANVLEQFKQTCHSLILEYYFFRMAYQSGKIDRKHCKPSSAPGQKGICILGLACLGSSMPIIGLAAEEVRFLTSYSGWVDAHPWPERTPVLLLGTTPLNRQGGILPGHQGNKASPLAMGILYQQQPQWRASWGHLVGHRTEMRCLQWSWPLLLTSYIVITLIQNHNLLGYQHSYPNTLQWCSKRNAPKHSYGNARTLVVNMFYLFINVLQPISLLADVNKCLTLHTAEFALAAGKMYKVYIYIV